MYWLLLFRDPYFVNFLYFLKCTKVSPVTWELHMYETIHFGYQKYGIKTCLGIRTPLFIERSREFIKQNNQNPTFAYKFPFDLIEK